MFLPKEPACLTSLFMVSLLHPYENCKFFSWDPHIFTQIPGASTATSPPNSRAKQPLPSDGWMTDGRYWEYHGDMRVSSNEGTPKP